MAPRRDKDSMSFRFDRYRVVPDTDRARVLLVQNDQNWALLHFAFTEDHFGIVEHVSRAALERLGLSVTVFRCLLDWVSALLPQAEARQVIGAFDLVRWALDRKPDRFAGCAAHAKHILERALCGTPWELDQEKWDSEQVTPWPRA